MTLDLAAVDDLFATELAGGRSPGLAYAVVRDGEVLHHGAHGTTTPGEAVPAGVDSVQRIASMSKSFTASAVLLLRDRGLLRLDDPVSAYVPEVAGARFSADSPDLTVRHLLTMTAGLLTDDPWGDRNESQTYAELGAFLAGGLRLAARPGTTFEYSNLGYALLGRVVESLTGGEGGYRRFVLDELTGPLGMSATRYDVREVGPALVTGFRRRGEGWAPEPPVRPGTFSAMGGVHSSLHDLARWVGGFTDAFRRPEAAHPLSAASRREMQQLQRFIGVGGTLAPTPPAGGTTLAAATAGYGFGLFVEHHSDHGHVVHHSGGYPGYGSHMRWHPETGLGVIGLANGTYAAPGKAAESALRLLVAGEPGPVEPPVATPALVDAVTAKLAGGAFTDDLFTYNVPLDVPEDERQEQLERARGLVGAPTGPATAPVADGLGTARWSVPAEHGRLDVAIKVAPTVETAVQSVVVTAVPEPPAALTEVAERALAGAVDGPVARALAVASALGTPALAGVLAGDGSTTATYAVRAGGTWWRLVVAGDPPAVTALTAAGTTEQADLAHRFGG